MPNFVVTCDGRTATCTCNDVNACRGMKGYDGAAMNTIVFGRGSSSCSDAKSADVVGMCDIFPRITPANVKIVYAQTGLGYAGRRGGPMPTITVSLQNLPFQFFFLRGPMGCPLVRRRFDPSYHSSSGRTAPEIYQSRSPGLDS